MEAAPEGEQTPDVTGGGESRNGKRRKADSVASVQPPVLFTVGANSSKAKRKLNMDKVEPPPPLKNVPFQQKGPLSPSKKSKQASSNEDDAARKPPSTASLDNLMDKLNKVDSKEVKAKIKTVNKLADLQAQLKSLRKDPNLGKAPQSAKRALFQDDKKLDVKKDT